MNNGDQDPFEAELRKLSPARPPAELMARLVAACPKSSTEAEGVGVRQSSGAFRWGRAEGKRHEIGALPDDAAPTRSIPHSQPSTINYQLTWRLLLRWLAPATAVAGVLALIVLGPSGHGNREHGKQAAAADKQALKADDVEFDQQLVAAFDAVARMPDGQPVRFRCREWTDEVVLRDSARGIVVEQRTPRLEVVPVSFETY